MVVTSEKKETIMKSFFPDDERLTMPNISGSFSPKVDHSLLNPKIFSRVDEEYHNII